MFTPLEIKKLSMEYTINTREFDNINQRLHKTIILRHRTPSSFNFSLSTDSPKTLWFFLGWSILTERTMELSSCLLCLKLTLVWSPSQPRESSSKHTRLVYKFCCSYFFHGISAHPTNSFGSKLGVDDILSTILALRWIPVQSYDQSNRRPFRN